MGICSAPDGPNVRPPARAPRGHARTHPPGLDCGCKQAAVSGSQSPQLPRQAVRTLYSLWHGHKATKPSQSSFVVRPSTRAPDNCDRWMGVVARRSIAALDGPRAWERVRAHFAASVHSSRIARRGGYSSQWQLRALSNPRWPRRADPRLGSHAECPIRYNLLRPVSHS